MSYKYDNYREDILPFIPKDAKTILDVGCGTGKLLGRMKVEARDCYGIEPNYEAFLMAELNVGENKIINKNVEDAINDIPNNFFDVILLLDVLEHLIDPLMVLKLLKVKLNKEGIIISSIPNIRYFHTFYDLVIKKEFQYAEYGVMDKTHLRFFTYKSILKLFNEAGYSIIQQKGINPTPSK